VLSARATGKRIKRTLAAVPPASGAVVMGTGIESIALSLAGREILSRVLLVICAIAWLALGLVFGVCVWLERERAGREARSPAALTGVAGTGVLATRLTTLGWKWAGIGMLVIGVVLWLALLAPVLAHWAVPTVGVSFVLAVSTESLAVLAVALAAVENARWLLFAALAPFVLGLVFYPFVIWRFEWRQLLVGGGDQWIAGGALAISALAAGQITLVAASLQALTALAGTLKAITIALWALSILWLPALLVAEAIAPRVGYDVRRWATVFPVGMYAACSFVTGAAGHGRAITQFARVWVWVSVGLWLIVFAAMCARATRLHGAASGPTPHA
jgi:Voltage-dependent anion channel